MREAKEDHDKAKKLGISPAMIEGYSGPSFLYHNLNHEKVSVEKRFKG